MLLSLRRLRLAEELDRPTGGLDLLAGIRGDRVHADRELLRHLPGAEQLDVDLRVLEQPLLDERFRGDDIAALEAIEIAQIDRRRFCPEGADRHRVLRRRPAQLADAHVDRHLPALEACAHLVRAGARLLALDTAAGELALAGAWAAP